MEYVKGKPYFSCGEIKIKQYPYLTKSASCDILIVGGGIDGAIANYFLSQKYDTMLVDKSRFGYGCTSCATALCEYQLDDFAADLSAVLKNKEIVMAYKLGLKSIDKIAKFVEKHGNNCHFSKRPTFLYTDSKFLDKRIFEEYEFRKEYDFDCQLITDADNPFNFEVSSGIYVADGGCELNPYLFAKQMIESSKNQDKIFEHTHIISLEKQQNCILAKTAFGETICCKKVIVATGFNWEFIKKEEICERFISYSIVTNVVDFQWFNRALIHDVKSPYHYLRLLPDNRIIFGGEDTKFKPGPIDQKKANKKYKKLFEDLCKMFPNHKDKLKVEYEFCGCFGATENNLGVIGKSSFDDDILMFISCGANGIIHAMIGVELIDDILQNKPNEYQKIFSPSREVF